MSDDGIEALADAARNRGLKLVRSRVRTPGKRRFGKVGLTDAKGKPVFGMDAKGPVGSPEDAAHYLRNVGAQDWGASLNVAVVPRQKRKAKARVAANDPEPAQQKAEPSPKPEQPRQVPMPKARPKPQLRDAKPADAARLAELIDELGHQVTAANVRKNLGALKKSGETPIVVTLDRAVVGLIGVHRMITVHRDAPVGRIPVLVVAKEAQGLKLGRMLVEAAESWCRKHGCKLIEVTSNDRRTDAHAFYRHLGYERTSVRFFKKL